MSGPIWLALPACAQDNHLELAVPHADVGALRQTLERIEQLRRGGSDQPLTITLPSGTYRFQESLVIGQELVGAGLTLRASEPGKVLWSGGRALPAATRDSAGRWRYRLPEGWDRDGLPRVLVIDGRLSGAARHPNEGYLRIERALEDRRSGFTWRSGDLPAGLDLTIGSCDLVLLHDWSSSRLPLASLDLDARVLRTVGPIGCEAPHYAIDHFEQQPRYWLEGHPALADEPGEWYLDRQAAELVVVGRPDEDQGPTAVLPTLESLVLVGDLEGPPITGFQVEGIVFTETRFPMPDGGLAAAQATMHEPRTASGQRLTSRRPMLSAAVRLQNVVQARFVDCQFRALGGTGLWLAGQCRESRVERCRFDDLGGNGLNLGEDHARHVDGRVWYQSRPEQVSSGQVIQACEIAHVGRVLPGAVGIWAGLNQGLVVEDNYLHDCPYTGISLGWIWNDSDSPAGNNRILNNRIEFVMQVLSDGGGIYTLGRQPGSLIAHNRISDVPLNAGRAESNGMFLDEGTTGFTIQHNTIRRIDRSPLRFHRAGKNLVRENRWELATPDTPPIRFNNTPEENITSEKNTVVPAET